MNQSDPPVWHDNRYRQICLTVHLRRKPFRIMALQMAPGRKPANKWTGRQIAAAAAVAVLAGLLVQWFIRSVWIFPYRTADAAMAPVAAEGSLVFLRYPSFATAAKNDIVLVFNRNTRTEQLCRIAALEGERVAMVSGEISVNGTAIPRRGKSDPLPVPETMGPRDHLPETGIRPGHFFCLNDNRNVLTDSRLWGELPLQEIRGIGFATGFIFSRLPETGTSPRP